MESRSEVRDLKRLLLGKSPPAATRKTPLDKDAEAWQNFVRAWNIYTSAKSDLLTGTPSLVELVRQGLIHPNERHAAFDILGTMKTEQLQQLLSTLIEFAAYSAGGASQYAAELILKIPHEWVVANIEAHAEPTLRNEDVLDYRGLFDLYCKIDQAMARRLTERALASSDPEIREAGEDFREMLEVS